MDLSHLILPAVVVVGAIFYMIAMRKRMQGSEAQHANARAGEVAARLGLTVVEGDPSTNFLYARALATKGSGKMPEVKVRLEGAPSGRPTEVVYYERTDVATGVVKTTYTTYIDARVVVSVAEPFPAFEILMRDFGYFASEVKPVLRADPCSFGDAQLDAKFQIKSVDARVGPVVAEGMRNLIAFGFVHIVGQDGALTFLCTRSTSGYLGQADQIHFALDQMAGALEAVSRGGAPT